MIPSPFGLVLGRLMDPKRRDRCSECEKPRLFGEPTCGDVECIASLRAAMFIDLDSEEAEEARYANADRLLNEARETE